MAYALRGWPQNAAKARPTAPAISFLRLSIPSHPIHPSVHPTLKVFGDWSNNRRRRRRRRSDPFLISLSDFYSNQFQVLDWTSFGPCPAFLIDLELKAVALRFSFFIAFHHPSESNGAQGIGGNRNAELSISTTPIYRHVISLVVFCLPAFLSLLTRLFPQHALRRLRRVCKATNEISQLVHLSISFGYLTNKVLTSAKNFQTLSVNCNCMCRQIARRTTFSPSLPSPYLVFNFTFPCFPKESQRIKLCLTWVLLLSLRLTYV